MIYWPFDSVVTTDGQGNESYDREFNSEKLRKIFKMLYTDGVVMAANSNVLKVSVNSGMNLSVWPGPCIIQGAMGLEENFTNFTVPAANANLPRIDSIVARLNTSLSARDISLVYLTGTAASSPSAPPITRANGVYDLRLANIRVNAGVTSITGSNVTDTRLGSDCGVASAVPKIISTSEIFDQYQAALAEFLDYVDQCLDGTVAGRLQSQIDAISDETQQGTLAYELRQLRDNFTSLQTAVNSTLNQMKIMPGTQFTTTVMAPIFITDSKKSIYFEVPMNRIFDAGVTKCTHMSSSMRLKYNDVYIIGTASALKSLTSLAGTIDCTMHQNGSIRVHLALKNALGSSVTNGRMGLAFGDITFKFE